MEAAGKVPATMLSGEASLLPPPPVRTNNSNTTRNPEDDDEYLTEVPPWAIKELIVAGLGICATILSIVIILIPYLNPLVFITGILGVLIAPYSVFQEQKITDTQG